MGLVGPLLGEDHVLNVPNTYFGVFFYALMIILGTIIWGGVSVMYEGGAAMCNHGYYLVIVFVV